MTDRHFQTFQANRCCPLVRGQTQRYGSVCDPVDLVRTIKGATRESATDTSAIITWTTTIGGRAVEAHTPRYPG